MTKTLAAAGLAVLLSLSACSSGSSDSESSGGASSSASTSAAPSPSASSEDSDAATAIADSIMKSQDASNGASAFLSMDRSDAECIGNGLVDEIGAEQLKKYKLVGDDPANRSSVATVQMAPDDAQAATGVLFECTDVEAMMKKAMNKSGSVPRQMQSCINKVLTEDNLRPMFGRIFEGKQAEAQKALTKPLLSCARSGMGG